MASPVFVRTFQTKLHHLTDHLGSVTHLIDPTGATRAAYTYTPFGERTKASGDLNTAIGYTGHHHHPTGLILTQFRAYDAYSHQWLTRDPIGEAGGINLYGYVMGNPINAWDPLGLKCKGVFDRNKQTLTLTDIDTGKSVTVPAFSGGVYNKNNKQVTITQSDDTQYGGPTPTGGYFIVSLPPGKEHPSGWFGLFKDDGIFNDSTWGLPGGNSKRDGFRLHGGKESSGCVTVPDKNSKEWKSVEQLLNSTRRDPGPEGENLVIYGYLIVK